MTSPARRHRERTLAALSASALGLVTGALAAHAGASASEYELMLARLGLDLRRLHDIQSIEAKIELKRELLPAYADWVAGVLAGMEAEDRGVQDEILTTIMIWRIDTGDFEGALPLGAAVLRYGIALPERYKRTPATLIVEEIADAALQQLGQGETFDAALLANVSALTDDADMHDQVRAKLYKAMGLVTAHAADATDGDSDGPAGGKRAAIDAAIRLLDRARTLNSGCGVKKELDRLKREAAKLAAAATANETPAG